jgi:hypothetical protein
VITCLARLFRRPSLAGSVQASITATDRGTRAKRALAESFRSIAQITAADPGRR